jgi:hypothetical protein
MPEKIGDSVGGPVMITGRDALIVKSALATVIVCGDNLPDDCCPAVEPDEFVATLYSICTGDDAAQALRDALATSDIPNREHKPFVERAERKARELNMHRA